MFDSDRPIQNHFEDRLGRVMFSRYLARCMLDHQEKDNLVIGLYGGWGVGKTSIINLVLEELQIASNNSLDAEKPIIFHFNPWNYSGQDQLIHHFFYRLASEIKQMFYLNDSEKILSLLELYASFFTQTGSSPLPFKKRKWMTRFFNKKEKMGWHSGKDIMLIKSELNGLLEKQKHKIIIIIDNISRIEPHEAKQIFQLVKSIADFSHTLYLLALDKDQIILDMNRLTGSDHTEYLEKIVQLSFVVPPIAKQDIETMLLERLEKIVAFAPEKSWDSVYWGNMYYAVLKKFFKNFRDITHYVNTLHFNFLRVKELVNPVDFFAITAIRVFEPDVYQGIRDNKDLFTDLMDTVYFSDQLKLAEDKFRCDEIFHRAKKNPPELIRCLCLQLFPRLRPIYEKNVSFYYSEIVARKNLQICHPDLFDIYFRLVISSGFIPESEMKVILGAMSNEALFSEMLSQLNQDNKIVPFLNALDSDQVNQIPQKDIGNVITAFFNNADYFPEGEETALCFNTFQRLHRIVHQLIKQLPTQEERFMVLQKAIQKSTKSLFILVHEWKEQHREHTETVTETHHDLLPDQLEALHNSVIDKIHYWAEIGRLIEHPHLLSILYVWKESAEEDRCKEYIETVTKEDRSLLSFLCAALKEPIDDAILKLEKDPAWKKYIKNIEDFILPEKIIPHAKLLFENPYFEKLREREQLALLIFLDLMNVKTLKIIPKTTV